MGFFHIKLKIWIGVKQQSLLFFFIAHCTVVPKCQNGGFVNHLCKCDCPSPLMGDTCEEVKTDSGI
jgi:hypothetical protein